MRIEQQGFYRVVDERLAGGFFPIQTPEGREQEPKFPTLILIEKPFIMGQLQEGEADQLLVLRDRIYATWTQGFAKRGCRTVRLRDANDASGGQLDSQDLAIISPVFYGTLPQKAQQALEGAPYLETEWDSGYKERLRVLKKTLPETWPLLRQVGQGVRKRMGIEPFPKSKFTNLIFLRDQSGVLERTSYRMLQETMRMFFTKTGTFNAIVAFYHIVNDQVQVDRFRWARFEGSHPRYVEAEELVEPLMRFASVTAAPKSEKIEEIKVPKREWSSAPAVRGMIELGEALGRQRLLSPQIRVKDYPHRFDIRLFVENAAEFVEAAEGAILAQIIGMRVPGFSDGCFFAITTSGSNGTIKTLLKPWDIVGVKQSQRDERNVAIVGMEGKPLKGASVEAPEFVISTANLFREDPDRYGVRLRATPEGYREDSRGEPHFAVAWMVHLHRGWKRIPPRSFLVPYDYDRHPPVGCGVLETIEIRTDQLRLALDEWNKRERTDTAAFAYDGCHGFTAIGFLVPDERGIVSQNTIAPAREVLGTQGFEATIVVPQVTRRELARPGTFPELRLARRPSPIF